jgi:hypothetical protein
LVRFTDWLRLRVRVTTIPFIFFTYARAPRPALLPSDPEKMVAYLEITQSTQMIPLFFLGTTKLRLVSQLTMRRCDSGGGWKVVRQHDFYCTPIVEQLIPSPLQRSVRLGKRAVAWMLSAISLMEGWLHSITAGANVKSSN